MDFTDKNKFSDVTFETSDNKIVYFSKFILCSHSKYFNDLFTSKLKEPKIIKIDEPYDNFSLILKIISGNYSIVNNINIEIILSLIDKYLFEQMTNYLSDYLISTIDYSYPTERLNILIFNNLINKNNKDRIISLFSIDDIRTNINYSILNYNILNYDLTNKIKIYIFEKLIEKQVSKYTQDQFIDILKIMDNIDYLDYFKFRFIDIYIISNLKKYQHTEFTSKFYLKILIKYGPVLFNNY